MCLCMHIYNIHTHIHTYIHTYTHTYIHTYTHTHTHTVSQAHHHTRIEREIKLMGEVDHANIARLFNIYDAFDTVFIYNYCMYIYTYIHIHIHVYRYVLSWIYAPGDIWEIS